MFGGEILKAICDSQVSIGEQMSWDATSAENVSITLVNISQAWAGNPVTNQNPPPTQGNLPKSGYNYTTAQIQYMVDTLAQQEMGKTGSTLQQLQDASSAWTALSTAMGNYADLQKSPFNNMQQGESSQIQQDQSSVSSSSSLGNGLADFSSIIGSLLPSLAG